MKKIFFAAIISLVTVLCVSATVADSNAGDNYSSSVTATVAGMNEGIDFDTKTLVVIYNLMPQKVKDLCVESYKDIAPRIEKSGKGFTLHIEAVGQEATDRDIQHKVATQHNRHNDTHILQSAQHANR